MSRLMLRDANNANFIDVFCKGGWKLKLADGSYLTMTPQNTKLRNSSNTGWVDLWCPIPVPTTVTGGSIGPGRMVDSVGYLWATGTSPGIYDDGTRASNCWRKVRNPATGQYVNNIKQLVCTDRTALMPSVTMFTHDGKVFFSGESSYGNRGNSTGSGTSTDKNTIINVTSAWEASLGGVGSVARIAQFVENDCIIRDDGVPFVLGAAYEDYVGTNGHNLIQGQSGAEFQTSYTYNNTTIKYANRWTRQGYTSDGVAVTPLVGVVSIAKTSAHETFVVTADGRVLQPSLYKFTGGSSSTTPPAPWFTVKAMRDLYTPFAGGTPLRLHPGALLETTSGDLFYPEMKAVAPFDKRFFEAVWNPLNINTQNLGSPVKQMYMETRTVSGVFHYSLFLLLDDGRLYVSGHPGSYGKFGVPELTTATAKGQLVLTNTNVDNFALDYTKAFLVKKDGTVWACGRNYKELGLGDAYDGTTIVRDWTRCVFA